MPDALQADDDALARRFVAGDSSAMERLYAKYRSQVYSWLVHTVGLENAGDVHQEAWMRVVRGIRAYRGGNFRAWLWRIVRNVAIDRARLARPQVSLDEPVADDGGATALELLESEAAGVLERMEERERAEFLRREIMSLPPPQREVVLLRVDAEMTFAEIAALVGAPLNTVLGRMRHAVGKLRMAMESKGV